MRGPLTSTLREGGEKRVALRRRAQFFFQRESRETYEEYGGTRSEVVHAQHIQASKMLCFFTLICTREVGRRQAPLTPIRIRIHISLSGLNTTTYAMCGYITRGHSMQQQPYRACTRPEYT